MIGVVDYGLGNLGSVLKAFRHVGAPVVLSGDAKILRETDALVVPGDGAFGTAMDELRTRDLLPVVRDAVAEGTPLLGICVGMQLLFEESEEHGRHAGLGLLPGRVRRFADDLVVPHMGWNRLRATQPDPLLAGIPDGSHVYFVHSYYCEANARDTVAATAYGAEVAAIVRAGNVVGMQFHPEKSQAVGLRLIANFVAEVGERRSTARRARIHA
jgi:glutamine amidotransferase